MTVATALLLPVVLLYQFWTYRVFRVRVSGEHAASPADILAPRGRVPKDRRGRRGTRRCMRPTPIWRGSSSCST